MTVRDNLFSNTLGASLTTVLTAPADTNTTITYSRVYNEGGVPRTLDVFIDDRQFDSMILKPGEGDYIESLEGATINAGSVVTVLASAGSVINIRLAGYEVDVS